MLLRPGSAILHPAVLLLIGTAVCNAMYQMLTRKLLKPFTYLQMLWATLLGYWVFDQLPDGWSIVGMAIILGSGVLLAVLEHRRARIGRNFP